MGHGPGQAADGGRDRRPLSRGAPGIVSWALLGVRFREEDTPGEAKEVLLAVNGRRFSPDVLRDTLLATSAAVQNEACPLLEQYIAPLAGGAEDDPG
jgi:hypothetical protein